MKKRNNFIGMKLIEAGYVPPGKYIVKMDTFSIEKTQKGKHILFDLKIVDEVQKTGSAQMDAYRYMIETMWPQSVGRALRKPIAMANPYAPAAPMCSACDDTGVILHPTSGLPLPCKCGRLTASMPNLPVNQANVSNIAGGLGSNGLPVYNCKRCLDTKQVFDFSGPSVEYVDCPECSGGKPAPYPFPKASDPGRTKVLEGKWKLDEPKDDIMSITRGMFK